MRKAFQLLGKILSYIYPYSLHSKLSVVSNMIFSSWISCFINSIGKDTLIRSGLNLIGGRYITIGNKTILGKNVTLTAWDKYGPDQFKPQIKIGNHTLIGNNAHITAINLITIGDHVLTGKNILITDNSHGDSSEILRTIPPRLRPLYSKGPVVIEDGVWIGEKASILPGCTIGKNSIIAANAVVTKNIPPNCVAGGIPAKVLKFIN